MEVSAKVDIAKSALQDKLDPTEIWMIDLLDSIQADLQNMLAKGGTAAPGQAPRAPVNLSRSNQARPEDGATPESTTPSAA
jgi:hypothetical protein